MKLISWNVNGLRAVHKKGFLDWLNFENPDILGLQEIKSHQVQLPPELIYTPGYHSYFNSAVRKGYSGTAIYSKEKPIEVRNGLGIERFDDEGRILEADYGDFTFMTVYFPNGKASPERLQYKLDFYDATLEYFNKRVSEGKKLLISGDYNTAHHEIDLARPKENLEVSGFLPIEREWMDRLTAAGYIDCFRKFNPDPNHYTWWSFRAGARERNVGWRIDYFFASANIENQLKNCYHLPDMMGSDHCPVVLEM